MIIKEVEGAEVYIFLTIIISGSHHSNATSKRILRMTMHNYYHNIS